MVFVFSNLIWNIERLCKLAPLLCEIIDDKYCLLAAGLCIRFNSVFCGLFPVSHDVQNRRTFVGLAENYGFHVKAKNERLNFTLILRCRIVVRTSNMKISRRRLADYVKTLHQKACCTSSTIIFTHSISQIIDLRRCCLFNSLLRPNTLLAS